MCFYTNLLPTLGDRGNMLTSTRGVVCQRRCYWFDRFVRTGTHNDSLAAVNENGRPVNKYGTGGRDRDTYFGYIPNHYELEERAMFDRKTIEPEKIRDPCDEIPDVMTFLERSDPDAFQLEEHESKFSDWNDLMTCSYMELVYRKSIPAAEAKMIWIARERYNSGETLHRRPQHDWKQWGKKRQENPPFPENYYPHMRIAKYRSIVQEAQTTGHTVKSWARMEYAQAELGK